MESPASWNRLTAALAVAPLERDPERAWAFVAGRGLVLDTPAARLRFLAAVREEIERGPITGPSVARRVCMTLFVERLAAGEADQPDPDARLAREEFARFAGGR